MMPKFPYKAARKMTLEDSIVTGNVIVSMFFFGRKQC